MDRVTRVGTHRSQDRLKTRLKDHFIKEDANGSIFRKNIGRSILSKNSDSYMNIWDLDTSKQEVKAQYGYLVDENKEQKLETQVSEYLRNNISFVCFPVDTEIDRLRFEEGIISIYNKTQDFKPSTDWFGLYSPIHDIARSGLWNRQGLDGIPLNEDELEKIKWLTRTNCFAENSQKSIVSVKKPINKVITFGIKITTNDIREYIERIFLKAKQESVDYVDLVSGQIHKELSMQNSMPQVCRIMREKMKDIDKILYTTPSGNSSTIKIRYYL